MGTPQEFRRRVLVVDKDSHFRNSCSTALSRRGYEVLTAEDGFEALCLLRGAAPDVLITELNLPRMSGFELLSIVRTRFPMISVIALSAEYTPLSPPHEIVCDVFIAKGPNIEFELIQEAERLISESPIRGSRPKSDTAPVWIPRSGTGYILLTCPECLRFFPAIETKPGSANETCIFCDAKFSFQMASTEVAPKPPRSPLLESKLTRARSRDVLAESRRLRNRINSKGDT
jgi:CheY-like chemotaxis protein